MTLHCLVCWQLDLGPSLSRQLTNNNDQIISIQRRSRTVGRLGNPKFVVLPPLALIVVER